MSQRPTNALGVDVDFCLVDDHLEAVMSVEVGEGDRKGLSTFGLAFSNGN